MFKLTTIFSIKSLLIASVCAILFWLLRDYPAWREQHKLQVAEAKIETSTSSKQTEKEQEKKGIENLSLMHYILVTPFAALYIIGRAIIDTIRYSLYFVIWSCEKSIPLIDDWLFDTVTIWLPKKYNDAEQWWIEKGRPNFKLFKDHLKDHTLPRVAQNLELFFSKIYQISCIIQSCTQDFIAAWKRFIQRHDWHQLAEDMSKIAFIVFWNPLVWIVTRSVNLGKLVYNGLRLVTISIKNDTIWICTVLIPTMYNYITSTRLAKVLSSGVNKLFNGIQWTGASLYKFVLVPTIGRVMTWLVNIIDRVLVVLLESHTIQEKLVKLYRWITPTLVWIIFESSSLVTEIVACAHLLFTQIVYPAYILFMKHVVPRLAIAYQSIIVQWIYELHLYPAWLKIYPYLNAPLFWSYTHLIVPVANKLYTTIISISHYVTQHQLVQLQALFVKVMNYTQTIYSEIQPWLIRQAPILSNMIYKLFQLVLNSCDWNGLRQDTILMATAFYDWISSQSNMIYLSLERSLTSWVEEQQEYQIEKKNK